jgi:polar amino acid transport system substrate-binding protein
MLTLAVVTLGAAPLLLDVPFVAQREDGCAAASLAMVLRYATVRYAMVKGIGADNWAGIAVRKEDPEIVTFLNGELSRMKADGSIYRIQEKWFGFRMTLADQVPSYS